MGLGVGTPTYAGEEWMTNKSVSFAKQRSLCLLGGTLFATLMLAGCIHPQGETPRAESVYDRIVRTKTIRAAWLTYPPAAIKDTVSGKMSGIFVDTLNRIGSDLGIKVEWMDGETPWGQQIEGLNEDRYDIVGSPVWANPVRGELTTLSRPVYYSGIGIYVRQNDSRFPNDWSVDGVTERIHLINRPEVRITTIDGETGDLIARTQFPSAQRVALPQNADIAEMFLNVANAKADITFAEPYFAYEYLKNNPGKIRNIAEQSPIRVLGNVFMVKKNEQQLKQMIDTDLEDLLNSGFIDILLAKYEPAPGLFYRNALPYQPHVQQK